MALTPRFNEVDIRRMLTVKLDRIAQAVLLRLQFIGEKFIANARNNGNYNDITGNLRSSIGYVVLHNGKQVYNSFPGENSAGRQEAKEVINQAKGNFLNGYALIVVAGMEYAAKVESKGKDVLTASSITAKNDLKKAIAELKEKIG